MIAVVIFFAGILSTALGILVWVRNKNNIINRSFTILTFFISSWIFLNFLFQITFNPIFVISFYAIGALIISAFQFFCSAFISRRISKREIILIGLPGIIMAILPYINGLIISDVGQTFETGYNAVPGPLFILYPIFLLSHTIIFLARFIHNYHKFSLIQKSQSKIIVLGTILFGIATAVVSFLLPIFKIWIFTSFDSPSSLFFTVSITYAITRYRFLDIKLIIFRSISFGIIIALITFVYTITSIVVGDRLQSFLGFRSDILVGLIVGLIVTLFYQPTRKFIENITNKILYKKSYNPDILLAKVKEVTSSILNLRQLLEEIAKTVIEAFNCEKFGVAILNKQKKLEILFKDGFGPGAAEGLVNYKNVVDILYQELERLHGTLVIDEMKTRYENGEFKPASPELLLALYQNDIALIIPLYVKDRLSGIIVIGNKKSGEPYNQQDLRILDLISGQSAVAIENAQLYSDLQDLNTHLQERVDAATKELRAANDQLRELDQAKSDFISIASHQLRTPLSVIKGNVSMLTEGDFGKVPEKINERLKLVYSQNERLIHLVDDLLDISRIESGRQEYKWQRADFVELAKKEVDDLKPAAEARGLKLFFHKPSELIRKVLIDPDKLHNVMMNFIDNAIKYTKAGQIDVSVTAEKDGQVTFMVKDTGKGITKEDMVYLFKKFSRPKGSFQIHTEGLGLGLFVAKMLIDAHHGVIGAESTGRDKGSKFFFTIPIDGPEAKGFAAREPIYRYLGKN